MRLVAALVLVAAFPHEVSAGSPEKLYYVGEVKLSAGDGKSMGSQVILLEKTHDRDKSLPNGAGSHTAAALVEASRAFELALTDSDGGLVLFECRLRIPIEMGKNAALFETIRVILLPMKILP